jgi:hypothetical protein
LNAAVRRFNVPTISWPRAAGEVGTDDDTDDGDVPEQAASRMLRPATKTALPINRPTTNGLSVGTPALV